MDGKCYKILNTNGTDGKTPSRMVNVTSRSFNQGSWHMHKVPLKIVSNGTDHMDGKGTLTDGECNFTMRKPRVLAHAQGTLHNSVERYGSYGW